MNPVALGTSVWLHFGTSSASTGAATNADSTPSVSIEENGTLMGYTPTVTNVATGLYRVQIDATSGNGFEVGKRYSIYAVATVGGVTGRDGIGEFEVLTRSLDTVSDRMDAAISSRMATFTLPTNFSAMVIDASGVVDADLRQWLGVTPNALISGRVDSNTQAMASNVITSSVIATDAIGAAQIAAGAIGPSEAPNLDVAVSSRMATFTLPANFSAMNIDASGVVDADLRQWLGTAPNALIAGRVDANTQAMGTDVITSGALATSAVTEIVQGIMTTVITESYRANGSPPTLEQFMSEVLAHLGEASITGTTKTIKRFDHSTTAETFTLDSPTAPTSITRTG